MRAADRTDFRLSWARVSLILVMMATLCGCASNIPLQNERATRAKLSAALDVPAEQISSYSRVLIGQTSGGASAPRFECIYVQTPQYAAVLDYNVKTKQFNTAFTFDSRTRGAVIQEKPTMLATLRQLQVRTDDAVLIMEFVNADFGTIGMGARLDAAYAHLKELGVPSMTPLPYVDQPPQPQTIYIPIYIPR
jgi:hypothetical protein